VSFGGAASYGREFLLDHCIEVHWQDQGYRKSSTRLGPIAHCQFQMSGFCNACDLDVVNRREEGAK
jgi:hypothetical protein